MTLIDWTRVQASLNRAVKSPNCDHDIELFRYIHTKPRAFIRKTQMLPSGKTVAEVADSSETSDFLRLLFVAYASRASVTSRRLTDDTCRFVLTIFGDEF